MRSLNLVLLSVCLLFSSAAGFAQDIDLIGQTGWSRYTRRLLEIYAERIENTRSDGRSGYLYLRVRATVAPSGGDFTGSYVVGSLRLGTLGAGNAFVSIDSLARYAPPPAGLYYTSMTVEESTAAGYDVVDYEDLDGIVNFGGFGEGAAQGRGSNGDLNFTGDVSWQSANGRVLLSAAEILNERSTASRALRLRLWGTTTPYDGGILQGQVMAVRALRRLRPGFHYTDLSITAPFRAPAPEGTYYTVLTLEEFVAFHWQVVDYVVFPDPSIF